MLYGALLDDSGDLPVRCQLVTGLVLLRQRLEFRLGLHLGEWFAAPAEGLPWAAWLQQRPPDVVGIGAALRLAIEAVPGVARVDDWRGAFDTISRTLVYSATIRTDDGTDAALTVGSPTGESVFPAVALRAIGGAGVLTR